MDADVLQAAPEGLAWVVVHARPRSEKKVVEFCRLQGAKSYLPLRKRSHRYGPRLREFHTPLFPGYVFCAVSREQQSLLRQNRHSANVLVVVNQDELLRQLRQIRLALQSGDQVELLPYIEVGKRVRVVQGPLKGVEGIIARIKGKTRIVINVDMIRESVAVDVEASFLDPA